MKSFKNAPTVLAFQKTFPQIIFNYKSMEKMKSYIEHCADEIGWLGLAFKDPHHNIYYIDDVMLFEQEVHATTTELTPAGLTKFAEEVIQLENGMELWNNIKVWGHSHVNMAPSPSGQDDSQMKIFSDCGHDWFIRIIANKKDEIKIDIFHFELGLQYLDVPFSITPIEGTEEMQDQITALYAQIDEVEQLAKNATDQQTKLEIAEKVKKKSYITPIRSTNNYGGNIKNYSGGYIHNYDNYEKKLKEAKTKPNPGKPISKTDNLITSIKDVDDHFSELELYDMAYASHSDELFKFLMTDYGADPMEYSEEEIAIIRDASLKVFKKRYPDGVLEKGKLHIK